MNIFKKLFGKKGTDIQPISKEQANENTDAMNALVDSCGQENRFAALESKAKELMGAFVDGKMSDDDFASQFDTVRHEFSKLIRVNGQPTIDKDTPLWLNSFLGYNFIDWLRFQQVRRYFLSHPEELVGETKLQYEDLRIRYDKGFKTACRTILEKL